MAANDVWLVGGLGTLQVNTEPFEVTGADFQPGSVTVRRDWIRSPYIEGAFLGNANPPRDIVQQQIKLLVGGGSQSAIQTNLTTLKGYLAPPGFTEFHFKVNNVEYAWTVVGPPDYAFGPTQLMTIGLRAPVDLTFFRQPAPLVGPL